MLHERDPVVLLDLAAVLKESLNQASDVHGTKALSSALNSLDATLAVQLQTMLSDKQTGNHVA